MQTALSKPIASYAARLEHLERRSRWPWLIRWLLVLPRYGVPAVR